MSLRERKKQQTLAAIVEAATKLFAEKGYEGTRTREIAEAAGIATGTLFNYAPTKSDVVLLLWKSRASELAERGLAAAQEQTEPLDAVLEIFGPIFAFYDEDRELGKIFLQNAIYANASDPEMMALNEGFVGQLAMCLMPYAGDACVPAASNVFAAYYLVVTMMLAGRLDGPDAASSLLRELVRAQAAGWGSH